MKKQTNKQKDGRCPNCHSYLVYGVVEGSKGSLCPHCLIWLSENKSNENTNDNISTN